MVILYKLIHETLFTQVLLQLYYNVGVYLNNHKIAGKYQIDAIMDYIMTFLVLMLQLPEN